MGQSLTSPPSSLERWHCRNKYNRRESRITSRGMPKAAVRRAMDRDRSQGKPRLWDVEYTASGRTLGSAVVYGGCSWPEIPAERAVSRINTDLASEPAACSLSGENQRIPGSHFNMRLDFQRTTATAPASCRGVFVLRDLNAEIDVQPQSASVDHRGVHSNRTPQREPGGTVAGSWPISTVAGWPLIVVSLGRDST